MSVTRGVKGGRDEGKRERHGRHDDHHLHHDDHVHATAREIVMVFQESLTLALLKG